MQIQKVQQRFRKPQYNRFSSRHKEHNLNKYILPATLTKYQAIEAAKKIAPYTMAVLEYANDPETNKFLKCWSVYPIKVKNGKITKTFESEALSNSKFIDRDYVLTTPSSSFQPCYFCRNIFNKAVFGCRLFTDNCVQGINIKEFENAKEGGVSTIGLKVNGSANSC